MAPLLGYNEKVVMFFCFYFPLVTGGIQMYLY